jgi:DNA-binding CsgD family transcriptional regulator
MPPRTLWNISDELDPFGQVTLLAFFSSLPVLLPSLDTLHNILTLVGWHMGPSSGDETPFLWTMPLTVMFTALAILFVCLLKTAYIHVGRKLVFAGACAYVVGYLILVIAAWHPDYPQILLTAGGIPLGFGLAMMCMTWATHVRLSDFRASLTTLLIVVLLCSAINAALFLLMPTSAILIAFALACLGTAGALRGSLRINAGRRTFGNAGSNWWDVFGKLDVSLVEGTDDFKAPASRILFFVATPLIMLLLFVINRTTWIPASDSISSVTMGCLLAVLCSIPLLFLKTDQALINASYRLYLPLMAFCVFVINSFVSSGDRGAVMSIGIDVFCTLYVLLLFAMIITMAGRMRSLVLPASSMLLIAVSLVALLSYTKMDAGALEAYQLYMLMGLFVLAVALLLITPGSRMWRVMLEGVAENDQGEVSSAPSFAQRCASLAQAYGLTTREAEILVYLGRGHSSAYVADILVVAESTIRSHRKNIYHKLGINSREELLEMLDTQSVELPSSDNSNN